MSLSLLVSSRSCIHGRYSLVAPVQRGTPSYVGRLWEILMALNPCEARLDDGFVCLCQREKERQKREDSWVDMVTMVTKPDYSI